jgi:hypothetical protein
VAAAITRIHLPTTLAAPPIGLLLTTIGNIVPTEAAAARITTTAEMVHTTITTMAKGDAEEARRYQPSASSPELFFVVDKKPSGPNADC